ncbi:hypothetical protein OAH12_02030, partial [Cyclobacteriaceae bacterium]|nr:hypothetical protein [Cyclobacteriaceae bacterium]
QDQNYTLVLYNIAVEEYLNKNYTKAEIAINQLITTAPQDYLSYAKMIQILYAQEKYKQAVPYIETLYKVYSQKNINVGKNFCFDQFEVQGVKVIAYENFDSPEGALYYKKIFYVFNQKGEIAYTVQTENPIFSPEPSWAIGSDKDSVHSTYTFVQRDIAYSDLKKIVINIIEKNITPAASSTK